MFKNKKIIMASLVAIVTGIAGCTWDSTVYDDWTVDGKLVMCPSGYCVINKTVNQEECTGDGLEWVASSCRVAGESVNAIKNDKPVFLDCTKESCEEKIDTLIMCKDERVNGEWTEAFCRVDTEEACAKVAGDSKSWKKFTLDTLDIGDGRYIRKIGSGDNAKYYCGSYNDIVNDYDEKIDPPLSSSLECDVKKDKKAIELIDIALYNDKAKCPRIAPNCVLSPVNINKDDKTSSEGGNAICSGCSEGSVRCNVNGQYKCTSILNDANNCGFCGNKCDGIDVDGIGQHCVQGVCKPNKACTEGIETCGVKENGQLICAQNNRDHCGACNKKCAPNEVCSNNECKKCDGEREQICVNGDGDEECIDIKSDVNNCGECGKKCEDELQLNRLACNDGTCVSLCDEVHGDVSCYCHSEIGDDGEEIIKCNETKQNLEGETWVCFSPVENKSCGITSCVEGFTQETTCSYDRYCDENSKKCVCNEGTFEINGECISPYDDRYCGITGTGEEERGEKCKPDTKCNGVECACPSNQIKCIVPGDNGVEIEKCISISNDNQYCGAIPDEEGRCKENSCGKGETCIAGNCQCSEGYAHCGYDKACINVKELPNSQKFCGAKGMCSSTNADSENFAGVACGDAYKCENEKCVCDESRSIQCPQEDGRCISKNDVTMCGINEDCTEWMDCTTTIEGDVECRSDKCQCKGDNYALKIVEKDGNEVKKCVDSLIDAACCGKNEDGTCKAQCDDKNPFCVNGICSSECEFPTVKCVDAEENGGKWWCVDPNEFEKLHIVQTKDDQKVTCGGCVMDELVKDDDLGDVSYVSNDGKKYRSWVNLDGHWNNGCETMANSVTACGSTNEDCLKQGLNACVVNSYGNHVCGCKEGYLECSVGENGERGCYNKQELHLETCGSCSLGYADFDDNFLNGCEIDLKNDELNCGEKGVSCLEKTVNVDTAFCVEGSCDYKSCIDSNHGNCDGVKENGCESDLKTDPKNCQYCNIACTGGGCEDGKCCYVEGKDGYDLDKEDCCDGLTLYKYKHVWLFCPSDTHFRCVKKEPGICWSKVE